MEVLQTLEVVKYSKPWWPGRAHREESRGSSTSNDLRGRDFVGKRTES